jgi:hypothetical protein
MTSQKNQDVDEYISQAEAARTRNVSRQAIADLVKRNRVSTITVAGRVLVRRSDIADFVPMPNKGRPRKKTKPAIATKKSPRKNTGSE